MDDDSLNRDLLAAHAAGHHEDLVRLYTLAADRAELRGDTDATCFFLTHAFVFALESGSDAAFALNQRLVSYGREAPL